MTAKTIGSIVTVVSTVLGATVGWMTGAFPLDVRLLIVFVIGLGLLAGVTGLFAHFGQGLNGAKRAAWSIGLGFVVALVTTAALAATLALHSLRYAHVPCESAEPWRCVQATAARETVSLTLTLSVQHLPGAQASWWPAYWSEQKTGSPIVREHDRELQVRLERFARPTRFGVSYIVYGSSEGAALDVSVTEPAHIPALSAAQISSWHTLFAIGGGTLWTLGSLVLLSWPWLHSLTQPAKPKPVIHTPE